MVAKSRLDAELVRRGLARSREHAQELVQSGRVRVAGIVATKAATGVDAAASVQVTGEGLDDDFVSRGGRKLAGSLEALARTPQGAPRIAGRRCLDAGASTGGFTDVLIRNGAAEVIAVDVGYGQLAWSLRTDARVRVVERTNVRDLDAAVVGDPVDLVVADLSFISLRLVLPALVAVTRDDADLLVLVKPQFEVGRERVGAGGVVRDPADRVEAVRSVAYAAQTLGWGTIATVASPLPGPAGNVEYFLWSRRDAPGPVPGDIVRTVEEGPA